MKQLKIIGLQDVIEIVLRRKWFVLIPLVSVCVAGLVYCLAATPIYRASTVILVQQQKVPEAYVQPTITAGIEDRLRSISQQILSRTRLEKIIDEFGLYPELRQDLFMEEVVDIMRDNIDIQVRGNASFQLSYDGKKPQVVATVANRLASLFIEENLKLREDMAEGTTDFLDRELTRVKNLLSTHEEAVRAFKVEHMGALPEQLDANLRSLEQLHLQLQTVSTALQNARENKRALQNQINSLASIGTQFDMNSDSTGLESNSDPTLDQLRAHLEILEARYTEKHPDVLRVKSQISKLEAKIQEEEMEGSQGEKTEELESAPSEGYTYNFQDTMSVELENIDNEINRLVEEQLKLKEKVDLYQKRIEDTPRREQELIDLQRDYKNTQKNYESLLDKSLNAQIAANMEKMQKGERFKILDPARIPEKPYRPNRMKIMVLTLFLGLCLGIGLGLANEIFDQTFRDVDDLEQVLSLPVLASIPRIVTAEDEGKEKKIRKVVLFSSIGMSILLVALVVIHVYFFSLTSWVPK